MQKIVHIISYILLIALALPIQAQDEATSPFSSTFPKREERAVWLATIGGIDWPRIKATDARSTERQKQELIDILDQLKRANINVVILQTRIRGSVIYPSAIEPWDNAITGKSNVGPSYDPLRFAIDECHKRGMELHAWIVSIPLGTAQRQKAYGSKSITRHHSSLCKTVGGEMFMIPGNPATADYIASLCKEIVENYDVDGISLDYIRYPESQYHFSDDNLYKSSSGLTKAQWRRENITRIVKRVHDVVKPIKPWVRLSSSPIGKYSNLSRYRSGGWDCYDAVYQDPKLWLREGYQDMLFPMMYFLGNNYYPFVFDWKEGSSGHPVVPGLGIYFLDPREGKWQLSDVRPEMHAARDSRVGGIAFYRSYYLTNNFKGLYDCVCEEFFPYPALTSRMTWQSDTIPPSAPTDLQYVEGRLTWNSPSTSKEIFYNVYASWEYPVDISRAENLIAMRLQQSALSVLNTKGYHYAVTAIDRFGNESQAVQEAATETPIDREKVLAAIRNHYSQPTTTTKAKAKKTKKTKATKAAKTNTVSPTVIDFSKYLN